jgi:hypothetical protein
MREKCSRSIRYTAAQQEKKKHLIAVNNPLVWEEIQHSIKSIADVDQNITKILDEDELFTNLVILQT